MSYSDFTLKRVKEELNINVVENRDIFSHIKGTEISDILLTILKYNVPLAVAIGTTIARSEMIVVNVLIEVKRILEEKISLFSGINFDVDKGRSLNGFCDFIISKSPEQFYINAPVIAIVESKDDKTTSGLGQCVAEMYASSIFNEKDEQQLPTIYGAITTGSNWRFLKYKDNTAFIDFDEYPIENASKIVGILVNMLNQNA
ncbi:MAG: hypothetical protein DRR19_21320 [Candidatus Parabeggiatoa sp. nov. 1]|nr:MAG: hypothetical protein DRR19_21320 [Gammaproteobacteria bacterium]